MTEAVKHTPGPWSVEFGHAQSASNIRYFQVTDGHDAICCNQFCCAAEAEANARLIAAAPELIDVVREMIPFLEEIARQRHPAWRPEMADRDSVLGRAYSVIAKAEGRS